VLVTGGSATVITTLDSKLTVGKTLTVRANGGDVIFGTGGNISIGTGLDYRAPVRVKQDQSITFRRVDVGGTWLIMSLSGARGAYRQEPVAITAADSPYQILPGSGTVRVDTSSGNVTVKLPSKSDAPPGARISIKKIGSANTVFINGATTAENPDGAADNATTLTAANSSAEFERNALAGSGGWDSVGSSKALAAALTIGTHLTGGSYDGSAPVTIATDATSLNTASTIVARNSSGGFDSEYVNLGGGTAFGAAVSIRETATRGYSIIMTNRNNLRSWGIAVDAVSVDDGIFTIVDLAAGASRLDISTTGQVRILNALRVDGQAQFNSTIVSNLLPTHATYDLGGGSNKWKDYYGSGKIDIGGNAIVGGTVQGNYLLTTAPASGTAALWRFGSRLTGGSYSIDFTKAVELEVGGFAVKIPVLL
jgi:hypothetical protein